MSKHTPELWESTLGCVTSIGNHVCSCVDPGRVSNASRIVTCVNACAGMTDPAAEIAELKTLSVKNILLDVTPGDGSGLEVYAQSATDVSDLLCKMDEEIAELKRQRDELLAALNLARDYVGGLDSGGPVLLGLICVIDDAIDSITGPTS